jgi:dihydroorotate dehydrogenase
VVAPRAPLAGRVSGESGAPVAGARIEWSLPDGFRARFDAVLDNSSPRTWRATSAVNTLSGIAVAPSRARPLLGTVFGGLSGPAIKPVALKVVYEVAQVVNVPSVAIGGGTELADVLDVLAVGAVAVQVGTAIFADPGLPVRLVDELAAECAGRGLGSHRELVGTALPAGRASAASAKGVEYRP